jgi:hypothetical protein
MGARLPCLAPTLRCQYTQRTNLFHLGIFSMTATTVMDYNHLLEAEHILPHGLSSAFTIFDQKF